MGGRAVVVNATHSHIKDMLLHVRKADIAEFWSASRRTPEQVLHDGLVSSTHCWAGVIDDRPLCIFGVAPLSLLGGVGVPWMAATDDLERHQFAFLRRNRLYVRMMMERYDRLVNVVDARNETAIRWLKWLGFQFGAPINYGYDRLPFIPFEMRRKNV